jgi:hypothetical protein
MARLIDGAGHDVLHVRDLGMQAATDGEIFEVARTVKHNPSWWRLAYTPMMPAEPPAFLTDFYVGVVQEMRGRGYVDDLLPAGTAILLEVRRRDGNEKPLRADTDVANTPMTAAFGRAGWVRYAGRLSEGDRRDRGNVN